MDISESLRVLTRLSKVIKPLDTKTSREVCKALADIDEAKLDAVVKCANILKPFAADERASLLVSLSEIAAQVKTPPPEVSASQAGTAHDEEG